MELKIRHGLILLGGGGASAPHQYASVEVYNVNNEHADRYNARQLVYDVCLPNTGG